MQRRRDGFQFWLKRVKMNALQRGEGSSRVQAQCVYWKHLSPGVLLNEVNWIIQGNLLFLSPKQGKEVSWCCWLLSPIWLWETKSKISILPFSVLSCFILWASCFFLTLVLPCCWNQTHKLWWKAERGTALLIHSWHWLKAFLFSCWTQSCTVG